MRIKPELTNKQKLAFKYLLDNETSEVLFGGAAGGGKSWIGCAWIIIMCLKYKGIRCLIGRSKLSNLKITTLNTFFEVCQQFGLRVNEHYTYNASSIIVRFTNGSEVLLKDLFHYPSDANYDSLGSLELTFAFVDECNQIKEKAKQVLSSRLRYKLDEYNLTPKILLTCNPAKNWVYTEFYRPAKVNKLPVFRKFIQSLVTDNPHISKHYEAQLDKLDMISKQRLLFGNWEYDDSDNRMIDYDMLLQSFEDKKTEDDKMYISADIARFGSDKTVIVVWRGLKVLKYVTLDVNTVTEASNTIKELQFEYQVPLYQIIVDEDGVGGGVKDILHCKGFLNNGKALRKENYQNLKTQCFYKLAETINKGDIILHTENIEVKNKLIQELELLRRTKVDRDTKLSMISKEEMKDILGRSPDYADAVMMRMYFEIGSSGQYFIS